MDRQGSLRSSLFSPLYRLYERRLAAEVSAHAVPRHIGIILDGNRRHGRLNQVNDLKEIYSIAANKLDDLLTWCADLAIPTITLWVLSTANFQRNPDEVSAILAAIERKMLALATAPDIHHRRVRVRGIGRLETLPTSTQDAIRTAETATKNYEGMHLTIAAAYEGRQEIADAVTSFLRIQLEAGKHLAETIELVTPEALHRHMYSPDLPDPDLIIRTSGEIRMSGFLMWQSSSSEFYFSEVNWPAFRRIDFLRAIRSFQGRHRRYGL